MTRYLRRLLPVAASALLGACASTPRVHLLDVPRPTVAPLVAVAALPLPPTGFWSQMRARSTFARCGGDPAVAHWAAHYSAHPQRFSAAVRAVLPLLRYVAVLVRKRGIPAEFVWLPWVESSYRNLPPRRHGAAGLWQLMPDTARSLGLRVDQRYDARLDLHAATLAALRLLARYQHTFHDWRLSDMAYNAGMYGIKQLIAQRGDAPPDGHAVPDLAVRKVTRDHLAKLMALNCIVRDPQRYAITLPDVDHQRTLHRIALAAPLDLHVAARLAGVPLAQLRRLNRANRNINLPVTHLLIGQANVPRFDTAYALLGQLHWQRWQHVELTAASSLKALVGDEAQRRRVLAQVNDLHDTATLPRHALLWLPQRVVASLPEPATIAIADTPLAHRVVSGDTLWDIARHFHVSVGELRVWNGLQSDLLHLGQSLRLTAPP